jgi:glycosyltransferase involved in cell wall biosynthesis
MMEPSAAPTPRVSVVVVAYGQRPFLPSAFRSLADQTLSPREFEVVLVSNFDPPADLLASAAPLAVRVVRSGAEAKGGMMAAGAAAARAPVLAWMDDDDRFLPGKLERSVERFRLNPALLYYHHFRRSIDAEDRPVGPVAAAPRGLDVPAARPRDLHRLVGVDFFTDSCTVVSASFARSIASWLATIEIGTDFALLFAALAAPGALEFDPGVFTDYRRHGNRTSEASNLRTTRRTIDDIGRIRTYVESTEDHGLLRASRGLERLLAIELTMRDPPLRRLRLLRQLFGIVPFSRTFVVRSHPSVLARAAPAVVAGASAPG